MYRLIDLAEHVKGTPDRYHHGWKPISAAGIAAKLRKAGFNPHNNINREGLRVKAVQGGDVRVTADLDHPSAAARMSSDAESALREMGHNVERISPNMVTVRRHTEIKASDLSSGDARRSREVTPEEFQATAKRGAAKYGKLTAGGSEPKALDGDSWDKIKAHAFTQSRDEWGGATIDAHTGEEVRPDADAYAVTVRDKGMDTVSVDPKASKEDFDAAMETAKARYAHILRRQDHPPRHLSRRGFWAY
jgi:hypothetical protein